MDLSDLELLSSQLFLNRYLLANLEAEYYYLSYDAKNPAPVVLDGLSEKRILVEANWRDARGKLNFGAVSSYFKLLVNRATYIRQARLELNHALYSNWFKAFLTRDYDNLLFNCPSNESAINQYEEKLLEYEEGFQSSQVIFVLSHGSTPL